MKKVGKNKGKGNRKKKKVVRKKNNIFLSGRIKIGHCRREKDVN
jgi:hypothetical protein